MDDYFAQAAVGMKSVDVLSDIIVIAGAEPVRSGAVAVYVPVLGTLPAKPILPKEGEDLLVRDIVEGAGGVIFWHKDTSPRTMTIITKSGGKPLELTEGTDFYIDKEGKSHFYNNVRTILAAQDYEAKFTQGAKKGESVIRVAAASGAIALTIKEGTDYFIGADSKAHFNNGKILSPEASPMPVQPTTSQQTDSAENYQGYPMPVGTFHLTRGYPYYNSV
jgi:hypothetical protein